jgi:hypothetical protein
MLRQPVPGELVRGGDLEAVALDGQEAAWADPRVERGVGDLLLERGEQAHPEAFKHVSILHDRRQR